MTLKHDKEGKREGWKDGWKEGRMDGWKEGKMDGKRRSEERRVGKEC